MRRITAAILAAACLLALCSCGKKEEPVQDGGGKPEIDCVEGEELMAFAESENEAREIAAFYGIEFVRLECGVAVFHTEEDPFSVIQKMKDSGREDLELNSYTEFH